MMPSATRTHPLNLHIGQMIRALRHERGWNLQQLAEPLLISRQQLQKYETGQNSLSCLHLWRLAQQLETVPERFFSSFDERDLLYLRPMGNASDERLLQVFAQLNNDDLRHKAIHILRILGG